MSARAVITSAMLDADTLGRACADSEQAVHDALDEFLRRLLAAADNPVKAPDGAWPRVRNLSVIRAVAMKVGTELLVHALARVVAAKAAAVRMVFIWLLIGCIGCALVFALGWWTVLDALGISAMRCRASISAAFAGRSICQKHHNFHA